MPPAHPPVHTLFLWRIALSHTLPHTLNTQHSYSNEAGTDAAGAACDRAYWLVDRAGDDAPVFTSLKAFYAAADAHLAAARAAGGPLPDLNAFRRWAVANLVELSGYSGVPPPAFRELDLAAAAIGGGH